MLTLTITTGLPLFVNDTAAHEKKIRPATFSIIGKGTVNTTPDIAFISSGVVSQGPTPKEALAENSQKMGAIFDALKRANIEKRHIQTSNFQVSPRYVHHNAKRGEEQRPPRIVGYQVNNTVTVKIINLDHLGAVLSEMVTFGANKLGNIRFDISNREALLDDVRKAAVRDAQRKAEIYLNTANAKLGRLISIAEGRAVAPRRGRVAALAFADAAPVPVATGENKLSISVTITWEIIQ